MNKIFYYLKKIYVHLRTVYKPKRIKKFGIRIALLDTFIFLMRRNNSYFNHKAIQMKDKIVQRYLYVNYEDVIKRSLKEK